MDWKAVVLLLLEHKLPLIVPADVDAVKGVEDCASALPTEEKAVKNTRKPIIVVLTSCRTTDGSPGIFVPTSYRTYVLDLWKIAARLIAAYLDPVHGELSK